MVSDSGLRYLIATKSGKEFGRLRYWLWSPGMPPVTSTRKLDHRGPEIRFLKVSLLLKDQV